MPFVDAATVSIADDRVDPRRALQRDAPIGGNVNAQLPVDQDRGSGEVVLDPEVAPRELAMLFALLGGLSVFGALGIVLGPVVFATAAAIIDTLRAPQVDRSTATPSMAARQDVV